MAEFKFYLNGTEETLTYLDLLPLLLQMLSFTAMRMKS